MVPLYFIYILYFNILFVKFTLWPSDLSSSKPHVIRYDMFWSNRKWQKIFWIEKATVLAFSRYVRVATHALILYLLSESCTTRTLPACLGSDRVVWLLRLHERQACHLKHTQWRKVKHTRSRRAIGSKTSHNRGPCFQAKQWSQASDGNSHGPTERTREVECACQCSSAGGLSPLYLCPDFTGAQRLVAQSHKFLTALDTYCPIIFQGFVVDCQKLEAGRSRQRSADSSLLCRGEPWKVTKRRVPVCCDFSFWPLKSPIKEHTIVGRLITFIQALVNALLFSLLCLRWLVKMWEVGMWGDLSAKLEESDDKGSDEAKNI